jgi:hypothetical protein
MNMFSINRLSLSGEECQIFSSKILSWAVPSLFDLCFLQGSPGRLYENSILPMEESMNSACLTIVDALRPKTEDKDRSPHHRP